VVALTAAVRVVRSLNSQLQKIPELTDITDITAPRKEKEALSTSLSACFYLEWMMVVSTRSVRADWSRRVWTFS
jgi:hypothetical protein